MASVLEKDDICNLNRNGSVYGKSDDPETENYKPSDLEKQRNNSSQRLLAKRSPIQRLLKTIKAERRRERTSSSTQVQTETGSTSLTGIQTASSGEFEDNDYLIFHSSANAFWTSVFSKYFISPDPADSDSDSKDDLVFFVRDSSVPLPKYGSSNNISSEQQGELVQVFRKDSKHVPSLGDPIYNWEETVYLNLILQQFEYNLTCAVCSRTGSSELEILRKSTQKVYASPSHRVMDSKGTGESLSYPHIFFSVDNFEEAFCDIIIKDSEMVCVELVASDRQGDFQAVIFMGSIKYEALKSVFDKRQSSLSAKMRQSFSWGVQSLKLDNRRTEFIRMRGPQRKGYAEMAISRQRGVPDTPQTTPLTTPHDTPRETPSASPTHSPSRESLPPFPDDVSYENSSAPDAASVRERRLSESLNSSPFKNSLRWGFGGLRKSQSASDHVSHMTSDSGEVEAKSISEELHQQNNSGIFGKSFGQAWHWFKEQRRAASVGLNCCLTYVTIPWHRIMGDVLEIRCSPVLSF